MTPILEALQWRYATKQFDTTKKVSDADVTELSEALRLTASSYGLQPWKFFVISDPAIREQLKAAAWGQAQLTDASHVIVLCAKTNMDEAYVDHYIDVTAKTRNVPAEGLKGFRDMMMGSVSRQSQEQLKTWNQKQVYIALGTLLAAAALKKIDACPMEGFDPAKFDEILGLAAEGFTATVICPIGYRAEGDPMSSMAKVRFAKDEVIESR